MNTKEIEVFIKSYEDLRDKVNPRDIAEHLWNGQYAISHQKQTEDAYNEKYSECVRMNKLLPYVELTITDNSVMLYTFLEFLDRFWKNKPLVQKMRSDLAGEL